MKKYIVLSVNDNNDYLFYVPLCCWAWRKFGWEPIVMFYGDYQSEISAYALRESDALIPVVPHIEGYRSDTITQLSRLYAAAVPRLVQEKSYHFHYLMTGDIDMIPLSDYWKPQLGKGHGEDGDIIKLDSPEYRPTVWGHDLTGYGHYPICYVGMMQDQWAELMSLERHLTDFGIKRDLDNLPQAKNPDFYKYWFTDQDLITQKLKPFNPTIINRGQYSNGYAVGRVDRGAWSLNHSTFVDCHMFQQLYHKNNRDKFDKTMELLTSIWPDEDFGWFRLYTDEFRKLTGHA